MKCTERTPWDEPSPWRWGWRWQLRIAGTITILAFVAGVIAGRLA